MVLFVTGLYNAISIRHIVHAGWRQTPWQEISGGRSQCKHPMILRLRQRGELPQLPPLATGPRRGMLQFTIAAARWLILWKPSPAATAYQAPSRGSTSEVTSQCGRNLGGVLSPPKRQKSYARIEGSWRNHINEARRPFLLVSVLDCIFFTPLQGPAMLWNPMRHLGETRQQRYLNSSKEKQGKKCLPPHIPQQDSLS